MWKGSFLSSRCPRAGSAAPLACFLICRQGLMLLAFPNSVSQLMKRLSGMISCWSKVLIYYSLLWNAECFPFMLCWRGVFLLRAESVSQKQWHVPQYSPTPTWKQLTDAIPNEASGPSGIQGLSSAFKMSFMRITFLDSDAGKGWCRYVCCEFQYCGENRTTWEGTVPNNSNNVWSFELFLISFLFGLP